MGTASWFAWDGPSLGTNNASEMGRITQRRQKSGGEWAGEGSGDRKWLSGRTSGRPGTYSRGFCLGAGSPGVVIL